jgi:general secretion pathway protein L
MQTTIIVRLLIEDDTIEWMQLDEQGQVSQAPTSLLGPELQSALKDARVILVVPGIDVLLTSVQVPKMSSSRLSKAVPNLLEDEVAESIDNLHFAIGKLTAGEPLDVAVVSKLQMQKWLNFLEEKIPNSQRYVDVITPDTLCLPWAAGQWTGVTEGSQVLLRTGQGRGFAVDADNFVMVAKSVLEESAEPDVFVLYQGESSKIKDLDQLNLDIDYQKPSDSLLQGVAEQIQSSGIVINLLQGEFQSDNSMQLSRKLYRSAGMLALIWISLLTVADMGKYWYLSREVNALSSQITAIYKDIFPNARSVVSPKRRVERLLSEAEHSQSNGAFMSIMTKIAPILDKASGIELTEMVFSGNDLQLQVEAGGFDQLDRLLKSMQVTGLVVNQTGATKSGDTIQTRITIKR